MMILLAALMFCTTNSTGQVTQWSPGYFVGSNCQIEKTNIVLATVPNPSYTTWQNGVGAAWRWDTINGNFDVARANISAFLTSTNFPAYTVGQVSGANQDAWTINAAQIIGTQPPATLLTP